MHDPTRSGLAIAVLILLAPAVSAQIVIASAPALPIPDNDPTGVTSTINIAPGYTVDEVEIRVFIVHTYVGDLRLELTHVASGITVLLMNYNGCSNGEVDCVFSDAAPTSVDTMCNPGPPAIWPYARPHVPLSNFAGQDIGGDWRLRVIDGAPADAGILVYWAVMAHAGFSISGVPIPDNDPAGVLSHIFVPSSSTISDVIVGVDIPHTFVGDLLLQLTHLDTLTSVTLMDRPGYPATIGGCSGDNVSTAFIDSDPNPVEAMCNPSPPAIGFTCQPHQMLAAFAGEDRAGVWELRVSDLNGVDVGTFNSWAIYFYGGACPTSCGDCDGNGLPTPTITDALVAAQLDAFGGATATQLVCCDVNSTGSVTVVDALLMAQDATGLPVTLSCP
jgi:subtilisin-like proprotein convertase family protein